MAIENKEPKKSPEKGPKTKETKKDLAGWFSKLFFPTLAAGSLLGGGFAMAALMGGLSYGQAHFETKEPHPLLDKIGDAISGITSKP